MTEFLRKMDLPHILLTSAFELGCEEFCKNGARWQISQCDWQILGFNVFSWGVMSLQKTIKVTGFLSSMIDDIGHCKHCSFVLSMMSTRLQLSWLMNRKLNPQSCLLTSNCSIMIYLSSYTIHKSMTVISFSSKQHSNAIQKTWPSCNLYRAEYVYNIADVTHYNHPRKICFCCHTIFWHAGY